MTSSPEGLPTKAKEAPCPHEIRLSPLDTNPVFPCLREVKDLEEAFKDLYIQTNLCNKFLKKLYKTMNFNLHT